MNELDRLKEMAGIFDAVNRGGYELEIDEGMVYIESAQLSEPPGPAISMTIEEFDVIVSQY
ncbi:unnamed protein product, partial [marine sediment metagenome]